MALGPMTLVPICRKDYTDYMRYLISCIALLFTFSTTYAQTSALAKAAENGSRALENAGKVARFYPAGVKVGVGELLPVYSGATGLSSLTSSVSAAVSSAGLAQQVTLDMQRLRQVVPIGGNGGVYGLENELRERVAYAKVSNAEEIERTNRAYQLIYTDLVYPGGLRQKYPDIEIECPLILAENTSILPETVRLELDAKVTQFRQHTNNSHANLLNQPEGRVFVMSAVDTGGMSRGSLFLLEMNIKDFDRKGIDPEDFFQAQMHNKILEYLDGQPMTWREWHQVRGFISDMGQAGLPHGDLMFNLFLKRNPETHKLKVTLIDFEEFGQDRRMDEKILDKWESILLWYHVLVR